jgi:hypothetical protein
MRVIAVIASSNRHSVAIDDNIRDDSGMDDDMVYSCRQSRQLSERKPQKSVGSVVHEQNVQISKMSGGTEDSTIDKKSCYLENVSTTDQKSFAREIGISVDEEI